MVKGLAKRPFFIVYGVRFEKGYNLKAIRR